MIPLRDDVTARRMPAVNYMLIAACTIVFGVEWVAGPELEALIERNALIPRRFLALGERLGFWWPPIWLPFITSVFLHGGIAHFVGNMWFLWIFGANVEDRLGHLGYLLFYLAGGIAAGVVHVGANPGSILPTIGASGAIAAVMGAYLVLHPRARIHSLLILGFLIRRVEVPALLYLALWFALQLIQGTASLGRAAGAGVAWWAHAGGFLFGAAAILFVGVRPIRAAPEG